LSDLLSIGEGLLCYAQAYRTQLADIRGRHMTLGKETLLESVIPECLQIPHTQPLRMPEGDRRTRVRLFFGTSWRST
jgi:hypothetical protein